MTTPDTTTTTTTTTTKSKLTQQPPFDPISTIAASLKTSVDNATYLPGAADGGLIRSNWQYEPATSLLPLQPSEYAYMSQWDRDNVWRQAISLYVLT